MDPGHYRPISLYTSFYKICAKLLVRKLKSFLTWLICPEQGAFIGGFFISDNILIASEFMYDLQKAPGGRYLMAIKFNTKIAYDRMC